MSLIHILKGRREDKKRHVFVLAPKGEKERHESTHLKVERRKETRRALPSPKGENERQMVKGIEAKSSYTQGE